MHHLPRAELDAGPGQLPGGPGGGGADSVLLELARQPVGDDQLLGRHPAGLQFSELRPSMGHGLGQHRPKLLYAAGLGQDGQDLQLGVFNEGRRVVASGLDPAQFERAVFEGAEVAVGDRHPRFGAGGEKSQPAVDAFQTHLQTGASPNAFQESVVLGRLDTGFVNPQPVNVQVQHLETLRFHQFLGAQQRFPAIGVHRLVGFDPAEAGVLVSEVAEAGDQQPFVGGVAPLVALALGVARRQLPDQSLVAIAFL